MPRDKADDPTAAKGDPAIGRAAGAAFADRYRRTSGGARAWLSVHLPDGAETAFGARLLKALAVIDARLPGAGDRFADELAAIRYVSNAQDSAAWKAGFEQLIQKLGEVLVARILFEAEWPQGTTFGLEPANPVTGARPEILVDTPARQWLFEVKCPAFIDYQDRRDGNGRQLPVRGPLGDVPGMRDDTTLPRDNVLKDFLENADRKFRDFTAKPRTGLLVVLWDGYIFEITSALSHEHAGLLTDQSWHQPGGVRVPFDAVDGVIVLNHLEVIKVAAQEYWQARQDDPFRIEDVGQPPNVWCPNLGRGALDPHIAEMFNAWPLDEVAVAADYGMARNPYGSWTFFNRHNRTLGKITDEWSEWDDPKHKMQLKGLGPSTLAKLDHDGLGTGNRIYFYDDGRNPENSTADMRACRSTRLRR